MNKFHIEQDVIELFRKNTAHALFFQSLKQVGVGVPDSFVSSQLTGPVFIEFKLVSSPSSQVPWRPAQLPWNHNFVRQGGKSVAVVGVKSTGEVWVFNMCHAKQEQSIADTEHKMALHEQWKSPEWSHPQLLLFRVIYHQNLHHPCCLI